MEIAGAGDKLVVIDFCVAWSKTCKKMESKVKELSKKEPNVIFLYVDTDIVREAIYKFNLFVLPTFVFIKKNNTIDKMIGTNIAKLKVLVEKNT